MGESIRCPYHGWEYDAEGRCVRVPMEEPIPAFAAQQTYPVEIRHGFLFFFNGRTPLFPLPFFLDGRPDNFVSGRPFRFIADCSWFLLMANGFDLAHFRVVHDRALVGTPVVDTPAPYVRRIRWSARVTGHSPADRFLRAFVGDRPEISIVNWGGSMTMVSARFRRGKSYMLIAGLPLEDNKTLVEVIPFAPRSQNPIARRLWQPIELEVRRWLTRAFMRDDIDRLSGIAYNPHSLTGGDREMIEFFRWLTALPQTARPIATDPFLTNGFDDSFRPLKQKSVL